MSQLLKVSRPCKCTTVWCQIVEVNSRGFQSDRSDDGCFVKRSQEKIYLMGVTKSSWRHSQSKTQRERVLIVLNTSDHMMCPTKNKTPFCVALVRWSKQTNHRKVSGIMSNTWLERLHGLSMGSPSRIQASGCTWVVHN